MICEEGGLEVVFEKGVGIYVELILEFSNVDGFDCLVVMIGIDCEIEGKGDCEFVVFGDGVELFLKRMCGIDLVFELDVDIINWI